MRNDINKMINKLVIKVIFSRPYCKWRKWVMRKKIANFKKHWGMKAN